MSQRNRDLDVPMQVKQEVRARAHSERHRIRVELHSAAKDISGGVDPADVHEPGAAWKPMHHHDAEVAKSKLAKRSATKRHWKTKMWKRRTQVRRDRTEAWQEARQNSGAVIY
jgi:hypothetical protein